MEFLALKRAITDYFHEYLYGGEFDVYTDKNPLTYILTTVKLDATGQRWMARLASYHFSLHYRSGKSNIDADALSRIPWARRDEIFDKTIDESAMKAIICAATVNNRSNTAVEFSPILYPDLNKMDYDIPVMNQDGHVTPAKMTNEDWIEEQMADPVIREIHEHLLKKTLH